MKTVIAMFVGIFVLWATIITGWVSNLIWLIGFNGETTTEFWVALIGALAVPLGAFHGLYVLF